MSKEQKERHELVQGLLDEVIGWRDATRCQLKRLQREVAPIEDRCRAKEQLKALDAARDALIRHQMACVKR